MNYYLQQHCYSKNSKILCEGNLLVLKQEYLFEGENQSNQLWVGLEETPQHMVVIHLEDGMREKKRKTDFYGVLNLSHIQESDLKLLEKVKHRFNQDDYRFWDAKKFSTERLSRFRVITELGEIILAVHMNDKFTCEYSIWLHKESGGYQMIANWGGDYEKAKLDFAMETGLMKEGDLPKGG